MRFLFFTLTIIVNFSTFVNCQSIIEHNNSRSAGLGRSSFSYVDNRNIFSAPGSSLKDSSLFASASIQNHFLIKELKKLHLGVGTTIKNTKVGIHFSQFGYTYFKEQNVTIASAKRITPQIALGILCGYKAIRINERNQHNSFNLTISSQVDLNQNWVLSALYSSAGINDKNKRTESGLGISYSEKDKLLLCFELIHTPSNTVTRFGTEINYKGLKIRVGSFNNFNSLTFGLGFPLKSLEIDFATQWHNRLGFSPETSLYYAN